MFSCLSEISVSKRSYDFFLYLKPFCKKLLNLVWSLLMNILCQLNKVTQEFTCICKQKTFSPVSSANSSQTDKALPVKTFKPNFVTFFVYFGNGSFDYLWNFFICYGSKPGRHFARNLSKFSVACLEKLEVNQWIALDIRWLSSQSERAKNTIHCF